MVKNLAANAGDADSISGSGRSPGGGNGNLLQYSCLENSMDRGAWWAEVHRIAKSWTQLSTHTHTHTHTHTQEMSVPLNFRFCICGCEEFEDFMIRSDQISRSVVSNSLRPHELQHTRPPCPSPTPGVHSDSRPSSQ